MAFNSPTSVFNDFRQAIIAEDWSKAAAQLAPEAKNRQIAACLALLVASARNNAEAAALLEKHGLTFEEVTSQLRPTRSPDEVHAVLNQLKLRIRNQTGFIGDCWGWSYERGGREQKPFAYVVENELADLEFNAQPEYYADMASGTIRYESTGQMIELEWIFSRAEDFWQIEVAGLSKDR